MKKPKPKVPEGVSEEKGHPEEGWAKRNCLAILFVIVLTADACIVVWLMDDKVNDFLRVFAALVAAAVTFLTGRWMLRANVPKAG